VPGYVVVVVVGGTVVVVGGTVVVVGGGAVVVVGGTVVVVGGGAVVVVWGLVVVVVELLVVVVVGPFELDPVVSRTMIRTIKMTPSAARSHGHQFRFPLPSSSSLPPGGRPPGGWYAPDAADGTTVVASPVGPVTTLVGWSASDAPWPPTGGTAWVRP
jgi:hypothetical protein